MSSYNIDFVLNRNYKRKNNILPYGEILLWKDDGYRFKYYINLNTIKYLNDSNNIYHTDKKIAFEQFVDNITCGNSKQSLIFTDQNGIQILCNNENSIIIGSKMINKTMKFMEINSNLINMFNNIASLL